MGQLHLFEAYMGLHLATSEPNWEFLLISYRFLISNGHRLPSSLILAKAREATARVERDSCCVRRRCSQGAVARACVASENGGRPESNPFDARSALIFLWGIHEHRGPVFKPFDGHSVRLFVREIRDHKAQADIRGGGHPQNLTVLHRPSGIDENMVYQTPEELAEYEDIIQRTFGSEAEGYEFFNSFAKSKGFSLRKGNVQYLENKDNINSRQFLCSKEGFRSAKNLNREDRQRRPRPMTRFSCSFEVVIKHNPEMNLWFVHKYIDAHNHEMATSKEVGFLFSHRKVTEPQKKEILDYQTAGLRKYQIVDVMEQQYGGNVGHVLRDKL
ncbi:hypothetical protein EJB05_00265, partial [Eragrostis curvula]